MSQSVLIPIVVAMVVIAGLVLFLASTRKSLTGPVPLPSGRAVDDGKYPSGYWMTIGMAAGVILGLLMGFAVQSVVGGISIGIGVGLILGKVLTQRYDKNTRQYTDEEKLERRRRASWGLIAMILLVLATLLAALLPLLDPGAAANPSALGFGF